MKKTLTAVLIMTILAMGALLVSGCQRSGDETTSQLETDTGEESSEIEGRPHDGPAPKIKFAETTHDFGKVSQRSALTHKFKVKNAGDAPLTLISAKAG